MPPGTAEYPLVYALRTNRRGKSPAALIPSTPAS